MASLKMNEREHSTHPVAAAANYVAQGWFLLPLAPRDKRPLTSHGVHDATRDAVRLARWQRCFPDANLGVATGALSGVAVVDIDPRNGGWETLEALEASYGRLPATRTSRTGDGEHRYYR